MKPDHMRFTRTIAGAMNLIGVFHQVWIRSSILLLLAKRILGIK